MRFGLIFYLLCVHCQQRRLEEDIYSVQISGQLNFLFSFVGLRLLSLKAASSSVFYPTLNILQVCTQLTCICTNHTVQSLTNHSMAPKFNTLTSAC